MPEQASGELPRTSHPLRIVMMGTGPFAVPAFDAIVRSGHHCLRVFTRPERPGPGNKPPPKSPVRQWAETLNLPVVAPESVNSAESQAILAADQPDLLVVCDYGQILKANVLELARWGGINLHGSLLPAFRGAAPVQWAVLSGQSEAGVSVIHMTPKLDAGPIITTRKTPVGRKETAGELEARLAQIGVPATLEAVEQLIAKLDSQSAADQQAVGMSQDPTIVSRAPRLSKADGRIDWRRPAVELDWHVRGMQPWPGAFSEIPAGIGSKKQPQRLMILDLDSADDQVGDDQVGDDQVVPGTVRLGDNQMWVACGDGWVRINRLKPAGKREMTAAEWLRGRPLAAGTVLT